MTVATDQPQTHAQRLAPLEDWHFWFVGRDELVKRQLSAYGSESPIVDVGCGTANFAHQLVDLGYDAYAMDFVAPPTSSGREIAGDAQRMPIGTESVATVLARDVLEHLDDAAMLSECRRILKPSGLLVALVPAWPSLWSERDVRAGHLRRYTRKTLRAAVESAGFEVLQLSGYQASLLPVAAISRAVSRRVGRQALAAEEAPRPIVNSILTKINKAEVGLSTRTGIRPPTGTSLLVVARRA